MKITVLNENTSKKGLNCEHGLSLYIQTGETEILFDTGQSDIFLKNAQLSGIDLSKTDVCILSHGHYDHGGGLPHFLKINHTAPIYIPQNAFGAFYNASGKYIGIRKDWIRHPQVILTSDVVRLAQNIQLISAQTFYKKYDINTYGLSVMKGDRMIPDDFSHEQFLLIKENGKEYLFSGCSHNGICNITDWFHPDFYIGGFHLSKLPAGELLKQYALFLKSCHTRFFTCHCTGREQYLYLKKYLPHLEYISTGDIIEI